jgi:hypothetical protein
MATVAKVPVGIFSVCLVVSGGGDACEGAALISSLLLPTRTKVGETTGGAFESAAPYLLAFAADVDEGLPRSLCRLCCRRW